MKLKLALFSAILALGFVAAPALAAGWSPSLSIGGALVGGPSATTWGDDSNIAVFVRGTDDALWWNTMPNDGKFNWAGWKKIGGKISSSPSCIGGANSQIHCYARAGSDNALWVITYQVQNIGQWDTWHSLGGGILGAPSATRWSPGHDVIFVRGLNDNQLYSIELNYYGTPNANAKFDANGGSIVTDPGCAGLLNDDLSPQGPTNGTPKMRQVACYAMGTPDQMFEYGSWYTVSDSTQKFWVPVDGATIYQPSLIYANSNAHDVYVTGNAPNNTLWHHAWRVQSGWGKWENLGGGQLSSGPSCIRTGKLTAVRTWCFAQGIYGPVLMKYST